MAANLPLQYALRLSHLPPDASREPHPFSGHGALSHPPDAINGWLASVRPTGGGQSELNLASAGSRQTLTAASPDILRGRLHHRIMSSQHLSEDEIRLYTHQEPLRDHYIYIYHLDSIGFESRLPLDVGRHDAGYGAGLAALDRLPGELLVRVLLALDMPTLTAFRAVNRHAMQTVDSLYEYATVVQNCPDILRAILALDARTYGLERLFDTLCRTSCRRCPEFGGLIHLYSCERTCESCACHIANTPVSAEEAARITNLSHTHLRAVYPCIRSLPGYYGYKKPDQEDMNPVRERLLLFDSPALPGAMRMLLPDNDDRNTRFMGVISAPYFEESPDGGKKHVANWGYYCAACRCQRQSVLQKFTRRGLVEHIREYGRIMWERGDDVYNVAGALGAHDLSVRGYRARHDDPHVRIDMG